MHRHRTLSPEGVWVIAGAPLLELLIIERNEQFRGLSKKARNHLMSRWKEKWHNGQYGRWTNFHIPYIENRVERPYVETDYFLTQVLSGHGCFRRYLLDQEKSDSNQSKYCHHQEVDVHHSLLTQFHSINMLKNLTTGEETWELLYWVIKTIIMGKEKGNWTIYTIINQNKAEKEKTSLELKFNARAVSNSLVKAIEWF